MATIFRPSLCFRCMNSSERDDVFKLNFNDYTLIVTGSIQIHFHERGVKIQKIVSKLTV